MKNNKKKITISIISLVFILILLYMSFLFFDKYINNLIENIDRSNIQNQIIEHEKKSIYSIFDKQKDFKGKCELTSNGLASCFEKLDDNPKITRFDNVISSNNGNITLTFFGDGVCKTDNNCKIEYKMKFDQDTTINEVLSIKADDNGYIIVK